MANLGYAPGGYATSLAQGGGSVYTNADGSISLTAATPAASTNAVPITIATGSASGSGNHQGGDVIVNLGTGSGTGRQGQLQIGATLSGAQTGSARNAVEFVTMTFSGLAADFTYDGIAALSTSTRTDTSSFNYTNRIRTDLTEMFIQTSGGTMSRIEVAPHLLEFGSATVAGTLTYGYSVSGELLHTSNSYTVTAYDAISGEIHISASGNAGTVSAINAYVSNTVGQTGSITTLATGVFSQVINANASTIPTANGVSSLVNNTGTGIISQATGILVTVGNQSSGTVTQAYGYLDTGPSINGGQITAITGMSISAQYNTSGHTSTTGGFTAVGFSVNTSTQGGNTGLTNANYGAIIGSVGGASGVGGTVNNNSLTVVVPSAVAAGTNTNIGVQITGNGGSGGTTLNYALYSSSTAGSVFIGNVQVGSLTFTGAVAAINSSGALSAASGGFSGAHSQEFYVGANGATNPAFNINTSTGSSVNGVEVQSSATGVGPNIRVISSAAAEPLFVDAKGTGVLNLNTIATGGVVVGPKVTKYNGVATLGWGTYAVYGYTRLGTTTNATATLATYTVGAADGSFLISANLNVTVSTTVAATVTCSYTDETNTPRVLTMTFTLLAGTVVASITTAQGNVPYEGLVMHIRAKASTTITLATAGTVTAVTYTGEGQITQIA